jgi:hypothetical protein
VNRVIPDHEIESFTDAFARRIAAFDKVAVSGIETDLGTAIGRLRQEQAAAGH